LDSAKLPTQYLDEKNNSEFIRTTQRMMDSLIQKAASTTDKKILQAIVKDAEEEDAKEAKEEEEEAKAADMVEQMNRTHFPLIKSSSGFNVKNIVED
jgi:hypothetical protein